MSYPATVLKVMIASPSDVKDERTAIREIIYEWNDLHSEERGLVLLPVAWETHSSPGMGERPQGIINKQVLNGCDLLVAAFWTRLGSPTGKAASGTVEELEEHLSGGKAAMIYFSSKPVAPANLEPDQWTALAAFRESLMQRGLFQDYEDLQDFRTKFSRQLLQTIMRDFADAGHKEQLSPTVINIPGNSRIQAPLSGKALALLSEAVQDDSGVILLVEFIGGTSLQTNGKQMIEEPSTARTVAEWRDAVSQLQVAGLIEYKREGVYNVTHSGYQHER